MSHKTGKRVLTASTSLALAVVGLAASPLAANAAVTAPVQGCGTADAITAATTDTITSYSIAGGATQTMPAPAKTVSGTNTWYFSQLSGAYNTSTASVNGVNAGQNFAIELFNGNTSVATVAANAVTNAVCTVVEGPAAVAPGAAATAGAQTAGAVVKAAPTGTAGEYTLTYTPGINFLVTDGGAQKTITAADFGTSPAVGATLTLTSTNPSVTVQAVPADSSVVTSPTPMASWTVAVDGKMQVAAPAKPILATDNSKITTSGNTADYTWYMTDTSVTTVQGAKDSGVKLAAPPATVFTLAAADRGTTKRLWAIINNYAAASFNGAESVHFDIPVPPLASVTVPAASTTYTDVTGTANDTVTLPLVTGVNYYYTYDAAPAAVVVGTNTGATAVWKPIAAGTPVNVPLPAGTTSAKLRVAAVLADSTQSQFAANSATFTAPDCATAVTAATTSPVYFCSPSPYTADQILTPSAPSYVDATGLADSVTMPAATAGFTYRLTVTDPAGGAHAVTDSTVASLLGQTIARQDWDAKLFAGVATVSGVDAKFHFTVTPAAGYNVPATFSDAVAPWTQTVYAGTQAAAGAPQFIDGATTETIKVTQQLGVDYSYAVKPSGTDPATVGDADFTAITAATPAVAGTNYVNGVFTKADIASGSVVVVRAKAAAGYVLSNANAKDGTGAPVADWANAFAAGTAVTPAAPSKDDQPGATADTYTINGATGVDYFVNGVKFDAAKFNLPQSTNGASSITVTAQAQTGAGYAIASGATTSWTLTYDIGGTNAPQNLTVDHSNVSLNPPTANVTWGADNATSYTVTYQKLLSNGARGPEMPWLTDTTETSANFVAMMGDKYYVRVVAMNDAGESDVVETLVKFGTEAPMIDIKTGVGTFNNAWQQLTNLKATQNLPYFGDTAALGYTNAEWTVTVPAGTSKFELYATVHDLGAAGKIQVNGQNWADFSTNSSYWSTVSDPYSYPVRTIGGWDTSKSATIKIIATDAGVRYLALDAYKVN